MGKISSEQRHLHSGYVAVVIVLSPFPLSALLLMSSLLCERRTEPDLSEDEGRRGSASPQDLSWRGGARRGRESRGGEEGGRR